MNEWEIHIVEIILGLVVVPVLGWFIARVLSQGDRLIRIETFMEIAGSRAFKSLHRDDNKYGIDDLVEKYNEHEDLPMEDWLTVLKAVTDPNINEDDKNGALALSAAYAAHKIAGRGGDRSIIKQLLNRI